MEEINVPPFFLCPISLEIMKDPVIISTGITYDRESIEKWIFSGKNNTCPVTKQALSTDSEITPNHTVRRLIQAWCTLNTSHGVERIPTPKPPINKSQIMKLLNDAKLPNLQIKSLQRLQSISAENDANKRCMEAAGAVEFLASLVVKNTNSSAYDEEAGSEEALSILHNLKISEPGLKNLVSKNGQLVESLTRIMRRGNYESRVHAVFLLKSMLEVADPIQLVTLKPEFFFELVQILNDQISHHATKAALKLLIQVCPWGRNKVKAAESGAVTVLIELILEHSTEKRHCEMMLMVLDKLCGCAEGRADLLNHGAGLAVVSKKILRVSHAASEKAVRILYSISKFSASPSVVHEMLHLGVVAKLCLVLQVNCDNKTREKAREILKLHARAWKNSSCIPPNLLSSYP